MYALITGGTDDDDGGGQHHPGTHQPGTGGNRGVEGAPAVAVEVRGARQFTTGRRFRDVAQFVAASGASRQAERVAGAVIQAHRLRKKHHTCGQERQRQEQLDMAAQVHPVAQRIGCVQLAVADRDHAHQCQHCGAGHQRPCHYRVAYRLDGEDFRPGRRQNALDPGAAQCDRLPGFGVPAERPGEARREDQQCKGDWHPIRNGQRGYRNLCASQAPAASAGTNTQASTERVPSAVTAGPGQ